MMIHFQSMVERGVAGTCVKNKRAAGLELLSNQVIDAFLENCSRVIEYRNCSEAADKIYRDLEYLRYTEAFESCNCHAAFGKDDDGEVRHDGLGCRRRR